MTESEQLTTGLTTGQDFAEGEQQSSLPYFVSSPDRSPWLSELLCVAGEEIWIPLELLLEAHHPPAGRQAGRPACNTLHKMLPTIMVEANCIHSS